MRVQVTIAFLLGVIAALLAVLVFGQQRQAVFAQSSSSGGGMIGVGGNAEPGGRNFLWVIDSKTETPHLTLYEWDGGKLKLHASRNIKYDLEFDQFPGTKNAQIPSVAEAYKLTEKARKDKRKGN